MIKKLAVIGSLGVLAALSVRVSAQEKAVNLNPGLWEITSTVEMVGMPVGAPPPMTYTQCITPEDLVPRNQGDSEACEVSDVNIDGNTVSWKISCSGQGGGMEGTGTITYDGDSMEGMMEMVMPSMNMEMKNTLEGTRVGECEGG